jgi:hypothetical protein
MTNFSQSIPYFIFSYSVEILLTLYTPDNKFLILNWVYFINIIILHSKFLFVCLFIYLFPFNNCILKRNITSYMI